MTHRQGLPTTLKTAQIAEEFVVLDPQLRASTARFTPTLYADLDRDFNDFKDHQLVSSYRFSEDWGNWEMHPAGDEVVMLMSGRATFVLERENGHQSVELTEPGSYVIVPKGTWHTARTKVPTQMLFITPGEGTRHRAGD